MSQLLSSRPASSLPSVRHASFDNLKVLLVAGVIVGHATMAWTGVGNWVFRESPVRDPLLTILVLVSVVGALFAMPLFFLVAGAFTARSLERKGPRRFLVDRAVRLGAPMLLYVVFLSPIIEYADPDNAGWARGFGPFIVHIWWPPAPGPTWFLGVLLVFSAGYVLFRMLRPPANADPPRLWQLGATAMGVAVASYLIRRYIPLGTEVARLALGQAPAWLAGFTLGVAGGEGGWVFAMPERIRGVVRWGSWLAAAGTVTVMGIAVATGTELQSLAGGGTWQSFLVAVLEGLLVVAMSLWLVDLFQRRFDRRRRLGAAMSRAAYGAFVIHQLVLVALVLGSRRLPWAPEIEYLGVATLGVALSFLLGALALRLPGASRVL